MDDSLDKTASDTIGFLEGRLRRIEFVLNGSSESNECGLQHDEKNAGVGSVTERLAVLHDALNRLCSKSRVAKEILDLHAVHQDLFQSLPPDQVPTTLSSTNLLSIVLSSATLYPMTASRLTSILDVPIPPAEVSTSLISLQPRIAKAEVLQECYAQEVLGLRKRTAEVLERWYRTSVLSSGECWSEWEGRVAHVEKNIRRQEQFRERESVL